MSWEIASMGMEALGVTKITLETN